MVQKIQTFFRFTKVCHASRRKNVGGFCDFLGGFRKKCSEVFLKAYRRLLECLVREIPKGLPILMKYHLYQLCP